MLYVFAFRNFCLDLAWMPKISNAYILWDFAWFQCPWFLETFWKTVWNPSHPARNACPRWRLQTLCARHNIWILSWLSLCDHSCLIMFNLSALIPIPPGSPSTKIMPNCSQNRWGKLSRVPCQKHSPRLQRQEVSDLAHSNNPPPQNHLQQQKWVFLILFDVVDWFQDVTRKHRRPLCGNKTLQRV